MKRKYTRKEELVLVLKAIDLPILVVQIELDNVVYRPVDYPVLKKIVEKELLRLATISNI